MSFFEYYTRDPAEVLKRATAYLNEVEGCRTSEEETRWCGRRCLLIDPRDGVMLSSSYPSSEAAENTLASLKEYLQNFSDSSQQGEVSKLLGRIQKLQEQSKTTLKG